MDSKFYFLAVVCLIGGLVGGYLIASTTLQNQTLTYELRLQSKDAELSSLNTQLEAKDTTIHTLTTMIDSQDALIQELKANVTKLQEQLDLLASQSSQAQTQVRIDSVAWDVATEKVTVTIRNTGSITADIESITIRKNTAGSTTYSCSDAAATGAIDVGVVKPKIWDSASVTPTPPATGFIDNGIAYVIRVTTKTGFFYELVATSPTS